ncbi:MAG: M28 family metallopeptidase [Acidobacteria bacterium]|nr:M28 family metallopeptidase [Acidobacteriota bacterium]
MAVLFLALQMIVSAQGPERGLVGFRGESLAREQKLESGLDGLFQRQGQQEWMKRMTAAPHHVGSPASRAVAEFMAEQFRAWGYETTIETFYPLFPTPRVRVLEMTAPERFTAKLEEPAVEGDATSGIKAGNLPVYNAYSIDGDVSGELVYVNYGVPADYQRLKEMGVDVKGKIVIARYGGSWRGIKPKVAAENGAVGCIIYSDPSGDGYFQGDVYPKGGYRPADSAQRGSVMDMPVYPGDPLTPGVGATDAKRTPDPKQAQTVTKIPVLPISYGDATPLLRALGGRVAPEAWRGALPFTYHVGPGPAKVHLKLEFDWKLAPAHNVVARMKGSEKPDEWVLRGNHHDGWNFGAADPISGMVAVMEEARVLGELAKKGWRPKRTVVFLGWDGEEPALLGSTEWAEQHAAELQKHAVVYINSDSTSRGFLSAAGTAGLEKLVAQAGRDVTDPQTRASTLERWSARRKVNGQADELRLGALGSGSDYTVFLHHLGIPSLNFGFGGEDSYGVYHSNYDSYDHFVRFVDPDFQYTLATAQVGARMVLRLANADALPVQAAPVARQVSQWTKEVMELAEKMRKETQKRNEMIRAGAFKLAADPRLHDVLPEVEGEVPYLNFAPLENAAARLERAAKLVDQVDVAALPAEKAAKFEEAMRVAEQRLLREEGLPRRPWFKHVLHAPGFYTGYGVKTLPGVREAIEQRNWKEAEEQIGKTGATINGYAEWLEKAAMEASGR